MKRLLTLLVVGFTLAISTTTTANAQPTLELPNAHYSPSLDAQDFRSYVIFRKDVTYLNDATVVIGDTTGTNTEAAALEIKSTTRGVLLPRMTRNQRVAIDSLSTGLLVYDTDSAAFLYYNGSAWKVIRPYATVD